MRGSTNSYNVLGSETKVLNIVQEGTLVRDNLTISGFDNGYFSPASRVSGGILSLDTSSTYSDIINNMANANSWKLNIKFETGDDVSNNQVIIGQLNDNCATPQIGLWDGGKLNICLSFNGSSWDYDEYYETLLVNTIYYLTLEFTGESYITTLYNSTKTLIATHTITNNNRIYDNGKFCFGADNGGAQPFGGKIYLEETNIEVDGQIGWRVVEIPGRITNIGDEIAVDLLLQQNKAKIELAGNLQGLGISADASTDTLEELAYKVSTVSADDVRQKPKAIALDVDSIVDESNHDKLYDGYVIKNGWFIWLYNEYGTLKLRRFKLSAMNISNYDTTKTISQGNTNVGTLDNGSDHQFVLNDDGSNVYIINNNTITKYAISGYDTTELTIPATGTSAVTYTPKFDYGEGYTNIDIYRIDVNSTETQMLVIDRSGNVGIFDLTGSTTQNISILDSNKDMMFFANNTNNNLIEVKNNSGVYTINTFSIVSGQLNLITTYSYNGADNYYWKRAFLKYKDGNNYKFIMNLGNVNSDVDPTFIIIDCATMNLTPISSKLNYIKADDYNNDKYIVTPTITTIGNYHYLLAGLWVAIFDNNWNLVGNVINRFYTDNAFHFLYSTIIYNNEIYDIGQNNTTIYAMKHKTWLDKLIAYERTVTITKDGQTIEKQVPYFAQLTETDLNDGVYNQ